MGGEAVKQEKLAEMQQFELALSREIAAQESAARAKFESDLAARKQAEFAKYPQMKREEFEREWANAEEIARAQFKTDLYNQRVDTIVKWQQAWEQRKAQLPSTVSAGIRQSAREYAVKTGQALSPQQLRAIETQTLSRAEAEYAQQYAVAKQVLETELGTWESQQWGAYEATTKEQKVAQKSALEKSITDTSALKAEFESSWVTGEATARTSLETEITGWKLETRQEAMKAFETGWRPKSLTERLADWFGTASPRNIIDYKVGGKEVLGLGSPVGTPTIAQQVVVGAVGFWESIGANILGMAGMPTQRAPPVASSAIISSVASSIGVTPKAGGGYNINIYPTASPEMEEMTRKYGVGYAIGSIGAELLFWKGVSIAAGGIMQATGLAKPIARVESAVQNAILGGLERMGKPLVRAGAKVSAALKTEELAAFKEGIVTGLQQFMYGEVPKGIAAPAYTEAGLAWAGRAEAWRASRGLPALATKAARLRAEARYGSVISTSITEESGAASTILDPSLAEKNLGLTAPQRWTERAMRVEAPQFFPELVKARPTEQVAQRYASISTAAESARESQLTKTVLDVKSAEANLSMTPQERWIQRADIEAAKFFPEMKPLLQTRYGAAWGEAPRATRIAEAITGTEATVKEGAAKRVSAWVIRAQKAELSGLQREVLNLESKLGLNITAGHPELGLEARQTKWVIRAAKEEARKIAREAAVAGLEPSARAEFTSVQRAVGQDLKPTVDVFAKTPAEELAQVRVAKWGKVGTAARARVERVMGGTSLGEEILGRAKPSMSKVVPKAGGGVGEVLTRSGQVLIQEQAPVMQKEIIKPAVKGAAAQPWIVRATKAALKPAAEAISKAEATSLSSQIFAPVVAAAVKPRVAVKARARVTEVSAVAVSQSFREALSFKTSAIAEARVAPFERAGQVSHVASVADLVLEQRPQARQKRKQEERKEAPKLVKKGKKRKSGWGLQEYMYPVKGSVEAAKYVFGKSKTRRKKSRR